MRNEKGQFVKGHRINVGRKYSGFGGMFGKHHSEESKRKIGEANKVAQKGKVLSESHKLNIAKSMVGKKKSEEARANMSRVKLGNKYALGVKKTLEQRMAASERQRGEKSHLWKGGISSMNELIRKGIEYKLWRVSVFERDNYTCRFCGTRSGNGKRIELHADHIKPFALYPELRFAIDNGRTLCIPCHKKTDTYGFRKHNVLGAGITQVE